MRWALDNSGTRDEGGVWKPWGGSYETQWHCLGEQKYKNSKGNAAKCPYSHKGKWFFSDGPSICGECGSDTETVVNWIPHDKLKHRNTLIRLVVWWCEEQPEDYTQGGLEPYAFPDGTPAVELAFRIPLYFKSPHGETYILCGYLDNLASFVGDKFTVDAKSTKNALSAAHFATFSPNMQFDVYDLAGSVLFPDLHLRGILVDAAQILQGGARFGLHPIYKTEAHREELLKDIELLIRDAEAMAEANYYPMRRANCWKCHFKAVCSMPPASRKMFLEGNFKKEHWNPLKER